MGKVGFSPHVISKRVRCCKTGQLSTTSARSAVRQPWSIIARTNFEGRTTSILSSRNCFKLLVKMTLRFSYCRVSVIQILTMPMQPSASCTRMWTVLSATIMFADKPHRLNERTSAQRFVFLTILPPVPHSRLGYPRSGLSRSDSCFALFGRHSRSQECLLLGKSRSRDCVARLPSLTHLDIGRSVWGSISCPFSPYAPSQSLGLRRRRGFPQGNACDGGTSWRVQRPQAAVGVGGWPVRAEINAGSPVPKRIALVHPNLHRSN